MEEKLLDSLARQFLILRKNNIDLKESVEMSLVSELGNEGYQDLRDNYTNKKLREILTDEFNQKKTIETSGKIIQRYEPVYMKPVSRYGRAQFYAPYKQLGKKKIEYFAVQYHCSVACFAAILYSIVL